MSGLGDQAVDHRVDACASSSCRGGSRRRARARSPSTRTRVKPALRTGVEHVPVLALAVLHQGREEQELRPRGAGPAISCTICWRRLLRDGAPAVVAGQLAHPRPEHAQVVVDLGHRAHGGAGVAAGRLLLDGDGGGEAADRVVERLVHLAEELPGVGVQALDVAALPLGVEGVEGEATTCPSRRRP